jgi:hypothetical protein
MALVVITAIMTVFWTGVFLLGWGPMQLLLEEDGIFEDQCLDTQPLPCPEQITKSLNVNFYAQLTMIYSPVSGVWVDLYGLFVMMTLSTIFLFGWFWWLNSGVCMRHRRFAVHILRFCRHDDANKSSK